MKAETVLKITDALNLELSDYRFEDLEIEGPEDGTYEISCKLCDREIEFEVRIAYEDNDCVGLDVLLDSDSEYWKSISDSGLWKYLTFHFLELCNNLEGRR